MPRDATWEVHADRALLLCGSLRAVINVKQPARGLHDLSLDQQRLADCEFLGIAIETQRSDALTDCYPRGGDLIVRYAQTADRPYAVEVYWRAGLIPIAAARHPYVDLVLSVQTSLLDSHPELESRTSLAMPAADATWNSSTNDLLVRFPSLGLSYVELIHPDDALTPTLAATAGGVTLTTRLFGQPLEKGVILRSRLRGIFVPLKDDRAIAAEAFRQFAVAPPPLTT
jgi:hypothetical protein